MANRKGIKSTNKIYLGIKLSVFSVFFIISLVLIISLLKFNVLPLKYLAIIVVILLLINILCLFFLIKKSKALNVIGIILIIILSCGLVFGSFHINKLSKFIGNVVGGDISYTNYYIVVGKDTDYTDYKNLEGKNISVLKNNKEDVEEYFNNKVNFNYLEFQSIGEVTGNLEDKKVDAMIISDSVYNYLLENDADFKENFRILHDFGIEKKFDNVSDDLDVTKPFIVYISGLDGTGLGDAGFIKETGLSDVNILAVVNPYTHKVLLVNTPRDYYVQLHGTTGMRDKLTHAGFYGVEMSLNTLQDLYNIKINAYLKVNFNAVISVVDAIDGIDVYSDKAFKSFKKGINHMNGKRALEFARERGVYTGGDRHRGANQQAVITVIIKKVSSSSKYLLKYDKIFGEISNYIATNIGTENIQLLLKEQLNSLEGWDVDSIAVDGEGRGDYSYTNPTDFNYVMEPDMETVKVAREKILEVMNEV